MSKDFLSKLCDDLNRENFIRWYGDEGFPDYDAELIEAAWDIIRKNPGIDCGEWINELLHQYPTKVVDALGNNPQEVFHTLTDWWEYKEYTDPKTGEWNTLKGWSEFYATSKDD